MHYNLMITDEDLVKQILKLHRAHKRKKGSTARKANVNNDLLRRGLEHPDTIRETHELDLLPTK